MCVYVFFFHKIDFIYPRTGHIGWTTWTGPATSSPSASPVASRRRRRPAWLQAQFSCSGLQMRTVQWIKTVSTVGKAKLLNHQDAGLAAHCFRNARLFVLTSAGTPYTSCNKLSLIAWKNWPGSYQSKCRKWHPLPTVMVLPSMFSLAPPLHCFEHREQWVWCRLDPGCWLD